MDPRWPLGEEGPRGYREQWDRQVPSVVDPPVHGDEALHGRLVLHVGVVEAGVQHDDGERQDVAGVCTHTHTHTPPYVSTTIFGSNNGITCTRKENKQANLPLLVILFFSHIFQFPDGRLRTAGDFTEIVSTTILELIKSQRGLIKFIF